MKKVIFFAPHTNDAEFGCGGTMAKYIEKGFEVHYVAFSDCKESIPNHLPNDILAQEMVQSMLILGIDENHYRLLDYPVRKFTAHRQLILEDMVKIKHEIDPDIVFIPNGDDVHQDHHVIYEEGKRAYKTKTIFGYEQPWNNTDILHNKGTIVLEEKHIKQKIQAIKCYQSQSNNLYAKEDTIFALAKTRGVIVNENFAEAFEVIRLIN